MDLYSLRCLIIKSTQCLITNMCTMTIKQVILNSYFSFLLKQPCFAGCAQTLPNATPPTDKIHPLSKIAVTFEPVIRF